MDGASPTAAKVLAAAAGAGVLLAAWRCVSGRRVGAGGGEGAAEGRVCDFDRDEVGRYSRQLILKEVQSKGMQRLKDGRVLIVGAGGLASSAGLYLAGAGVGKIGFVDFDVVEVSNLHRQIIHTTGRAGIPKVESAKQACLSLNPLIEVEAIPERFTAENGVALVQRYDVVLDATDNITARYLVNDACVIAGRPLVSGSALRWEGQLSVYNYKGGLCYRCAYPSPPPVHTVTSCADGGVIGAVPGTIGCLQSIEVQKILMDVGKVLAGKILLFNALDMSHMAMQHRPKNPKCVACGPEGITALTAYEGYVKKSCEMQPHVLPAVNEMSCEEYAALRAASTASPSTYVVVDVRTPMEFDVCRLSHTTNVPFTKKFTPADVTHLRASEDVPLIMLCRRGRASANAAQVLLDAGVKNVKNVTYGLTRWAQVVDKEFPIY